MTSRPTEFSPAGQAHWVDHLNDRLLANIGLTRETIKRGLLSLVAR
ncbi:hypothetical protein [Devosia nitrariae]|nr:hypothetical protein [Devosia nitrariae]